MAQHLDALTASGKRFTIPEVAEVKEEWNLFHGKEWNRVTTIGSGAYGSVYIGQRVEDQMVFAVKSTPLVWAPLHPIKEHLNALRNEIRTLRDIRCKYIVRMLGCGRSDGKNSKVDLGGLPMLDMFLEYIPRGSLYHMMKRLQLGLSSARSDINSGIKNPAQAQRSRRIPEAYVRAYTADILKAVDYLHKQQLVHGDIKTLNLLMADDCLKLADFGGCKSLKLKRLDVFQTRTDSYSAPEVYYKIEQGLASDIFSVGCCILEMTSGTVPETLFIPQWLSKDGQNFLRRCLTSDPSKRWTAAQLLQHPFIRDRDQSDRRPYSTAIPQSAEQMILQPPPLEIHSDPVLSPTYFGYRPYVAPVDPQTIAAKVYGTPGSFRKESIEISNPPDPPASSPKSDSHDKSRKISPTVPVCGTRCLPAPQTKIKTPVVTFYADVGTESTTDSTESSSSHHYNKPGAVHPVQLRAAAAERGSPLTFTDSSSKSNKPGAVHPVQLRAAADRGSPLTVTDSSSSPNKPGVVHPVQLRAAAADRGSLLTLTDSSSTTAEDKDGDNDRKEVRLPDYKPEFVPPDDNSLHFLLPEGTKKKSKGKSNDFDEGAATDVKGVEAGSQSHVMKPNSAGETENELEYIALLPKAVSNLSEKNKKQLNATLPNIQECNEEIREEAILAAEAGIYNNKLCPGAASTKNARKRGKKRTPSFLQMILGICSPPSGATVHSPPSSAS